MEHYEEARRLEREGNEREMSRRLEEVQLQQTSADQATSDLGTKLTQANGVISELEKRAQEWTLREKALTTQAGNAAVEHKQAMAELTDRLASVRADYEARLSRAADEITSLEGRISDLMVKENQLNSDLDQAKNDYEQRITSQDSAIQTLRDRVSDLQVAEENLQKQLEKTQRDCDQNIATSNENNFTELSRLSETLRMNESEFQNILQQLETAQKEVQNLSTRLQSSDSESTTRLEEATSTITDYEDKLHKLEEDLGLETKTAKERANVLEELQQRVENQDTEISARNQVIYLFIFCIYLMCIPSEYAFIGYQRVHNITYCSSVGTI